MRNSRFSSTVSRGKSGKEKFRAKKKQKRLDSICEKEYSRKRGIGVELNEGNGGEDGFSDSGMLRRSSRVRKVPLVLDASPMPVRKKRRVDNVGASSSKKVVDGLVLGGNSGEVESSRSRRLRLRSSSNEVNDVSSNGKRKLFENEEEGVKLNVVKFKSPGSGRITRSSSSKSGVQVIKLSNGNEVQDEGTLGKTLLEVDEEDIVFLNGESEKIVVDHTSREVIEKDISSGGEDNVLSNGGSEKVVIDDTSTEVVEKDGSSEGEGNALSNGGSEKVVIDDTSVQLVEKNGYCGGEDNVLSNGGSEKVVIDDTSTQVVEKDGYCGAEKPVEVENIVNADKAKHFSTHKLEKLPSREGRRCGLCGRGTDGKPPKRLVRDSGDSDNERYDGTSSSEEINYDVWDGFGDEPGWLGRILGPINDRHGIASVWVHQHCAVWSPEVYFAGLGCLKNVRAALCRGRALKCSRCGRPGATTGCRVDRCPKNYHLVPCARAEGCIFDHRKFLIACKDHRRHFEPHGNYSYQMKKLKTKKLKLEVKKHSRDACRKDFEAEEKWLEKCGEDEEFLKREGKRLHRDILRIAPIYIGGSSSESEKLYQGWESVAGLQDTIRCMKEVVLLPLLYPEFFSTLGLTPPRGVLLHGHPGTGKTLIVRALIGSCARGDKRIAYFARKGADCLGKYVGDAERQLRLLFQVAEKSQPSIIFFDEIDGLAPSRTRQQDQTHNSVVSTLLALMDGLKSRGSVVVIGATNRPDAIDPALRRPGRFDREIYFPLPSINDRASILSLHTQRWPKPASGTFLKWIARETAGFAGADLQALCTQAAMIALKRNCNLKEVMSRTENKVTGGKRFALPHFFVEERDWMDALQHAPPPCSRREAGMAANDVISSPLHTHLLPSLLQPLSQLLVLLDHDERIWLPPSLYNAAKLIKSLDLNVNRAGARATFMQNVSYLSDRTSGFRVLIAGSPRSGQRHLASCLLHGFLGHLEIRKLDLATLSQDGHGDLVEGITRTLIKCANMGLCIIYMPRIDLWAMETQHLVYETEGDACENICKPADRISDPQGTRKIASRAWNSLIEQVDSMCSSTSLIILATCEVPSKELPLRINQFFTTDVLSFNDSSPSAHTVPRFLVDTDGNFSSDVVIHKSATEISLGLVHTYVQFNHHITHICSKVSQLPVDVNDKLSPFLKTTGHQAQDSSTTVLPSNRIFLAISSFGYQVLCYPHFSELCWATSKLKEGPCADVPGPWKSWPFNSCILRPNNTLEKTVVGCKSGNIRDKGGSGIVRGLIAVGILAYRGVYTSVREVSVEVRRVLELLVDQVNGKIMGGKDRNQFLQLLSQAAYLEDMVNSWAYALQRLERNNQMPSSNSGIVNAGCPDSGCSGNANADGSDTRNCNDFQQNSQEVEVREQSSDRQATMISKECSNSNERITLLGAPNSEVRDTFLEEPSQQKGVKVRSVSDIFLQTFSTAEDPLDSENILNSQNKGHANLCISEDGIDMNSSLAKVNSQCNGLRVVETGVRVQPVDGLLNSDQIVGDSPKNTDVSTGSGIFCCYSCCSNCFHKVYVLVQNVLIYERDRIQKCWTLEDFHDVVESWSANLSSKVKEFCSDEKVRDKKHAEVCGCPDMDGIQTKEILHECRGSGTRVDKLTDCTFHSETDRVTSLANAGENSQIGVGLRFMVRDNVLISSDHNSDVLLHCSIQNLCLSSLIEAIKDQADFKLM
ncbi:hypothetical protein GIB67_015619 [Kingdonia uniflora]|uniref:PHD-type domain-containing protein n=1 Tax=Kingdonia uniflora TaxID=39325 RepID=A0A7J7NTY8_9MAGN|nr:hypothetical protein GIB67_015619 [Kingdonia uniflora]